MIGQKLIAWYEINKRNLPWRDTKDPYLIWVSEIILQQTRVNQGLEYYRRFTDTYPDVLSLANADIDDVLKIWQGLGYYSRARNMYTAAQQIVTIYQGRFPGTYDELIRIKGIGDYTASAVASLAFGQTVPVIDGNVNRVIARLFGVHEPVNKPAGQKMIRSYAEKLMVSDSPDVYNQAIMEFGALQCVPQRPDCEHCILNSICVAYEKGMVHILPIKAKTANIATRYFHYLDIRFRDRTYIRRRSDGDIWNGLYEFPMIETAMDTGLDVLNRSIEWTSYFEGMKPQIKAVSPEITHRLTHRILKIRFYEVFIDQPLIYQDIAEIQCSDIHRYAVPKVIENYIKELYFPK